eukprot:TRINITY_DN213_c0_g3_i1.p1 TRINITY_DN213_c0_g3~~TRINITY_DN213_c0_g3_i1.p1  ORF type:complete len:578 (+),score=178.29 TRINITY_DN213_c0_g3_i1:63-1736(+)
MAPVSSKGRIDNSNEPNVINEELILKVVTALKQAEKDRVAQSHTGTAGVVDKQHKETVTILDYKDVTTLNFSFCNIMKIDNLRGFVQLTKLQLDNNIIDKIQNLDHLVNLEWLDLSFNNLTKIEGLENLTKLTNLTLFNNQIATLEGLESQKNLETLSIGNNVLKNLDNLMYLRQFRRLRMVNITGNPVCADPEYRSYVLSHLKSIKYLDYRLIDPASVTAAKEQYQDELLELEEREKVEDAQAEEAEKLAARRAVLKKANMEGIDTLLDDVLAEDPEMPRLTLIEVLTEALPEFRQRLDAITEPYIERMLVFDQERHAERKLFYDVLVKSKNKNEEESRKLLAAFESQKKHCLNLLKTEKNTELIEEKFWELHKAVQVLYDDMMELELVQVDINEDLIKEFEHNVKNIFDKEIDALQTFFVQVRELEAAHHNNVMAAATVQYEKYQNNELDISLSDEGRQLLQEKDTVLNIVNGSHDAHLFRIDNKEDEMLKRETELYESWCALAHKEENDRNRYRVSEVWGYMARNRAEIDDILGDQLGVDPQLLGNEYQSRRQN